MLSAAMKLFIKCEAGQVKFKQAVTYQVPNVYHYGYISGPWGVYTKCLRLVPRFCDVKPQ